MHSEESGIKKISGNIVDVLNGAIYPGTIHVKDGRIAGIERDSKRYGTFIIPGLIDSHIHIESSMLPPSEFARLSSIHGTVAVVSDPHEIANVLGMEGIAFMLENGKKVNFKFFFGAPSCVPATEFETSGAAIGAVQIEELFKRDDIKFLGEMMNFPGVLKGEASVAGKLTLAKRYGKLIDGHAPGLRGEELRRYISAGPETDHETLSCEEGIEKLSSGMKIQIREGSAAKNLDALAGLIEQHPEECMFATDDCHPDDLLGGHINVLVKKAIARGIDLMKVLGCACVNPVKHYGVDVGLLRPGDYADFAVIDNPKDFNILKTIINGITVAEGGNALIPRIPLKTVNKFGAGRKDAREFAVRASGGAMNVIEVEDGQLFTKRIKAAPKVSGGYAVSDTERDILKIAVVNRYFDAPPSVGFVKNFGLKKGAIASSVSHDSHNIIAVGASDEDILRAVNSIIECKGGLSAAYDGGAKILPLPIGGLMSDMDGFGVAEEYSALQSIARSLGSNLRSPFMTLSFMALLVIPEIKLGDRGLFDGKRFDFIPLFE